MFYHFSQVLFIALLFPMISSALVFRFGKDPNVLVAENCLIVAGTSVGATNSATLDECEKSCLKNERCTHFNAKSVTSVIEDDQIEMLKKQEVDLQVAIEAYSQAEKAAGRVLNAALLVLESPSLILAREVDKLIGTIGQFTIPAHTPVTLAEYILAAIATSTRLLDTYTWFPSIFQDIAQVNSRLYYFFIVTLSLLIVTWNQVVELNMC